MKKLLLFSFVLFVSFGFCAYNYIDKKLEDIFKQLKITEEDAREYVWSNCSYGNYYYPSPKELKSLPESERPAIVKLIGAFAKEYSSSDVFAAKYKEYRESSKPQPPQNMQSADELRVSQKAQLTESIKAMEASLKNFPADQQKDLQSAIDEMKKQLENMDKPDSPLNSEEFAQGVEQNNEAQMEDYKQRLAQWEAEYPDNPKAMIIRWLKGFLSESATVDFNAATKENSYGRKIFVNPDYESKSQLWKLCFRAGKKTVEAGRAFASEWLKEIEK
jgi:predicted transcriptional regulator